MNKTLVIALLVLCILGLMAFAIIPREVRVTCVDPDIQYLQPGDSCIFLVKLGSDSGEIVCFPRKVETKPVGATSTNVPKPIPSPTSHR